MYTRRAPILIFSLRVTLGTGGYGIPDPVGDDNERLWRKGRPQVGGNRWHPLSSRRHTQAPVVCADVVVDAGQPKNLERSLCTSPLIGV